MSESDAQSETTSGVLRRRTLRWLVGSVALGLVLLVAGYAFLRPTARLNRLFDSMGLARLPASIRNLQIGKRGRFLGTRTLYIRFEADPNDAARFVQDSPMTVDNEPVPLRNISFGPRSPVWMTWNDSVVGRMYHGSPENSSVWLAIDDEASIVYVGVFEFRPRWLRRLSD